MEKMPAQAKDALMFKQEIIANNLANSGTVGFKKDSLAFHQVLDGKLKETIIPVQYTPAGPGTTKRTENPFDVAILGKGYFSIQTPEGIRYTREGSFKIDINGTVVTGEGHPVLTGNGPIVIEPERSGEIQFKRSGDVLIGEESLGRLAIVDFDNPLALKKSGHNQFRLDDGNIVNIEPEVEQGAIENSDVNPVEEMVEMIRTLHLFTANVRAGSIQDNALGRAIEQLT